MRWLPVLALLVLVPRAHADRVLVVETRGAPALPALASQIALHAGAQVDLEQAPDVDPMTFADAAAQRVATGSTTLVVWIAPVDHGYLVFVAGRSTGRALTQLVRIDASVGVPEIERTIALKVAGLLDAVFVEPAVPVRQVLEVPVTTPIVVQSQRELRLEVGAGAAYEPHERGGDARVGGAASFAWLRGPWSLAPMLGAYWQPSGTTERPAGRASIYELGGVAAIEGGRDLGVVEVFARPRFVAAGLTARGVSNDGRRGKVTVFAPYAGIEVGVRRAVSNVRFGFVLGGDFALIHRELAIDSSTVVDLGKGRLHVGLTMTVSL